MIPNLPIQLPGGWTLMPPAAPSGATPAPVPSLNLSGLLPGASGAPDLSGVLTALAPLIGAAVPQAAPFLPLVGVLFQIGHAIHVQQAAQPAGTNPSMDALATQFWSLVTHAFPLPGLTQQSAPMAG